MALHLPLLVCVCTSMCTCVHYMLTPALLYVGYKNEGWFDPWTLLTYLKKVAMHLGVYYVHGEVTSLGCYNNRITSVEVSNHGNQFTQATLLGFI